MNPFYNEVLFNRVMVQAYRWFGYYERALQPISNQLEILDPEVVMVTPRGRSKGHSEYEMRVSQLPSSWKNAHHIESISVRPINSKEVALDMSIVYQNLGIVAGGATHATRLHYSTTLAETEGVLPRFTQIGSELMDPAAKDVEFKDSFAYNRVRALAHYWLALLESQKTDPEPFREILSSGFLIDSPRAQVKSYEELEAWLKGSNDSVLASYHSIDTFDVSQIEEGIFQVTMEFEWRGYLKAKPEQLLEARSRHEWTVEDSGVDRFARIKRAKITFPKPFRPVQGKSS